MGSLRRTGGHHHGVFASPDLLCVNRDKPMGELQWEYFRARAQTERLLHYSCAALPTWPVETSISGWVTCSRCLPKYLSLQPLGDTAKVALDR